MYSSGGAPRRNRLSLAAAHLKLLCFPVSPELQPRVGAGQTRAEGHVTLPSLGAPPAPCKPFTVTGRVRGAFTFMPPASASTRQQMHLRRMGLRWAGSHDPRRAVRSRDRNMARTAVP
ncbi:hypothetical protein NDU88_009042 [Pleurodeles waltl]|uniref:Uncharacterized protein n=1 Tax=Pleurodeles waltl TaxID=8319 RepID=A0AAV7RZW1_PLEWA|nr:hypothetical protein NDU88_009042 [Pleurodeles waltl]